jgi:hypothetical protein
LFCRKALRSLAGIIECGIALTGDQRGLVGKGAASVPRYRHFTVEQKRHQEFLPIPLARSADGVLCLAERIFGGADIRLAYSVVLPGGESHIGRRLPLLLIASLTRSGE